MDKFGDGIDCPCFWCGKPLDLLTLQQDRLVAGGPYRRDNLVAACAGCNIARNGDAIPDGCLYGPVGALTAAEVLAGGR